MVFSKSFPRTLKGSTYPTWEEIYLDENEEKEIELKSKNENYELMKECLDKAKGILKEKELKDFQSDVVAMGVALFDKIAGHTIHHKEAKAKEKFDKKFKSE